MASTSHDCVTGVISSIRFTAHQIKLKLKGGKDVTIWKRKFVDMWGGSKTNLNSIIHQSLCEDGGGDWCVPILAVGVEVSLIRDASNDIGRSSIYCILSLSPPRLDDTKRIEVYECAISEWLVTASHTLLSDSEIRLIPSMVHGFVSNLVQDQTFREMFEITHDPSHFEDQCESNDESEDICVGYTTAVFVIQQAGKMIQQAIVKINIRAKLDKDMRLLSPQHTVSATELDKLSVSIQSYSNFRLNPFVAKMRGSKRPSFKTLDSFAIAYGLHANVRSLAAVIHKLKTMLSEGGHACCEASQLMAFPLLDWSSKDVENSLKDGLCNQRLVCDTCGGSDDIYLPHVYRIEQYVGSRISVMCKGGGVYGWASMISSGCQTRQGEGESEGYTHQVHETMANNESCKALDDVQRGVVMSIMTDSKDLLVLSGFPGTGKSRVSQAVCDVCEELGLKVLVCAPTAKAASRLGRGATTIHRALESIPNQDNEGFMFKRNAQNPLDADLVLIDETSMLDMNIAFALLQACKPSRTRLMLVGDANQLPSVDWGDFLGSLLRSPCVPRVFLDKVYRQVAGNNTIWPLARSITEGGPVLRYNLQSETVKWCTDDSFQGVSNAIRKLHSEYGDRMQIICPSRNHGLHTRKLNDVILGRETGSRDVMFEVGNRVVVTKNQQPDPMSSCPVLMNGDCGTVIDVDISKVSGVVTRVWIRLDVKNDKENDHVDTLKRDISPEDLDHAYALTIHKAQGSEYDVVVIVMSAEQGLALNRQALYTAVSRAVKRLYIFSSRETLSRCVSHVSAPRRGNLESRISKA